MTWPPKGSARGIEGVETYAIAKALSHAISLERAPNTYMDGSFKIEISPNITIAFFSRWSAFVNVSGNRCRNFLSCVFNLYFGVPEF